MEEKVTEYIFNEIKELWPRPVSLIAVITIVLLFLLVLFSKIDLTKIVLWQWLVIVVIVLAIAAFWYSVYRLPKIDSEKVTIVLSIATENDTIYKQIKSDFIDSLKRLADQHKYEYDFQVIDLPDHYSKNITNLDQARLVHERMGCHLLIFGRGVVRPAGNTSNFILELDGVIRHKKIPVELSQLFGKEFRLALPHTTKFEDKYAYDALKRLSVITDINVRYIVGLSAFFSLEIDFAINLLASVLTDLKQIPKEILTITKLDIKIPNQLLELYYWRALQTYKEYRVSKEQDLLNRVWSDLETMRKINGNYYPAKLLRAIYHFIKNKNTKLSKRELQGLNKINDRAWRYSKAFLLAWDGKVLEAIKEYYRASKLECSYQAAFEIEEFIIDELAENPDKYGLYVLLGLINKIEKEDYDIADDYFNRYLAKANPLDPSDKKVIEKVREELQITKRMMESLG